MSDSQLYSRLLLPRGHGYPLFHPQPYDDLCDIRKTGTEIGDVGVVKDGCFDVLFNICHPADHPINRRFNRGLPDGFEQLELSPASIAPHASYHPPGADISNTRINKRRLDIDAGVENNVFLPAGAGAVVEISASSKETAVLLLPDGASRWDLRPLRDFKNYAIKHARSWYNWVNGRLGWEVESGDLYLITGMDKSSTWSVLATENRSEDVALSLKLKAAQLASAGGSCTWEWESASSFANSGPRRQPGWEVPDGSPTNLKDQTVFLRGYKVAMRSSSWIKSPKTLSIVESKPSHILSKSGFVPKISQTKSSNASHTSVNPSSRGGASNEDSEGSVEQFPRTSKMYHPSDVINDFLLNSSLTADVAITHDYEWMSMVHADEKMPDDSELLERISLRYQPYTISGAVFLKEPIEQVTNATDASTLAADEIFTPKKKALLISIRPTGSAAHESPSGLHADVRAMGKLLAERYGYWESDIVMLLDSAEGVQPTRANIMRAISELVDGAREGDTFFFLYSGPTTHVQNRPLVSSEEDGMDECLVPADGAENKIDDNEIRRNLVDVLPVGSNLVMVFDSFHTGESLLNIPHDRENRVFVPWISNGRRNVRRSAGPGSRRKSITSADLGSKLVQRNSPVWPGGFHERGTIVEHRTSVPHFTALLNDRATSSRLMGDRPISLLKLPESAEVISLASCQESQRSWEDGGKSMTRELVRILQREPQPTLHAVLTSVRNELQRMLKRRSTSIVDQSGPLNDMDNFHPSLASQKPLDVERPFKI